MISQDGFFLPPPPPNSAPPPPISSNNNGFLQDDQNFIINNTSSSSSSYPNPNPNPSPNNNPSTILTPSGSAANTNNNNKRKRNLPGTPDPEAEVVALSPRSLMATNRFICEICNKGFQRDQNLQLHRRGHNLPWKLKQRANKDLPVKKKVYICPEKTCVHHDPSRALGDLTGIKKHFSRKHGEKKWKCDKCSKKYAVMSDWKAHSKICGTREYKCDCGTIFSRKDSFITHRAFCDALTEERMRVVTNTTNINHHQNATLNHHNFQPDHLINTSSLLTNNNTSSSSSFSTFNPSDTSCNKQHQVPQRSSLPLWLDHLHSTPQPPINHHHHHLIPTAPSNSGQILTDHQFSQPTAANLNLFSSQSSTSYPGPMLPKEEDIHHHHHHHHQDHLNKTPTNYPHSLISLYNSSSSPSSLSPPGNMSATALLQKAAQIGSTRSNGNSSVFATAFGHVMNNNNNNSSSTSPSPSLSNNNEPTTQRNQNHHLLNNHTTKQSSSTNHLSSSATPAPYSSGNLLDHHMQQHHKYSSSASLMGANDITGMRDQLGHHGGGGGGGGGNSNAGNNTLGMRDFLGTLGGSGSGNTTNTNSNSRSVLSGGGERRMVNSQDDHRNQMGYNFAAAMAAAGSTSTAHRGVDDDAREQEQYMDLMSQFNVDK